MWPYLRRDSSPPPKPIDDSPPPVLHAGGEAIEINASFHRPDVVKGARAIDKEPIEIGSAAKPKDDGGDKEQYAENGEAGT